jgi:hypothetical protein
LGNNLFLVTESRGEVIIKGKGVMETYFLLGTKEQQRTNTMYEEFSQEQGGRKDSS